MQSHGQEMRCYCYQNGAPLLLHLQNDADKIAEWILIKDDSAVVVTYMDKSCEQPWSFFDEKFQEAKDKNRVYPIKAVGDSLSFTKVFNFTAQDAAMSQEYIYNAKVYTDSLAVHIDYPASENSMNMFSDMSGPPDRMYIRVLKK